jgi:hypothetical protein
MRIKKRLNIDWIYWRKDLSEKRNKILVAVFLFLLAFTMNYLTGTYTTKFKGQYTPDILLDHFGPMNLGILYVWGYFAILFIFLAYPLFFKPYKLHIAIIMLSLLVFVRAIFICLTHLVTPSTAVSVTFPWVFDHFEYQNDLFFSGHTSVPFLGFLIFKNKKIKKFMLASSIIMAATVLLMHKHYSIDVFAAFFITYGVYKIGEKIFNEKLPA